MNEGLLIHFDSPWNHFRLTFEDNGRVAYAYLRKGNEIVGDLWLYNRCPTPVDAEWTDKSKLPFANPKEYTSVDGHITRSIKLDDVKVNWDGNENETVAYVYLHDDLIGCLGVNDKPGYARFAIKDGPLARVMEFS